MSGAAGKPVHTLLFSSNMDHNSFGRRVLVSHADTYKVVARSEFYGLYRILLDLRRASRREGSKGQGDAYNRSLEDQLEQAYYTLPCSHYEALATKIDEISISATSDQDTQAARICI